MSEHQIVAFRAIDRPLSRDDQAFMRSQSTRAEITSRSFDNEYHFGDFRGKVPEMMRRGFDFHAHYASFGIRTLAFRFPHGLPVDVEPYLDEGAMRIDVDPKGGGATLVVEPSYDAEISDEYFEVEQVIEAMAALRGEMIAGDLRPLYLMHLGVLGDMEHGDDEAEAPVPAGLNDLTVAQQALCVWFNLSKWLVTAAAEASPAMPEETAGREGEWLALQPAKRKEEWLRRLLSDEGDIRAEMRAAFSRDGGNGAWPTALAGRTLEKLNEMAVRAHEASRRTSEAAAVQARVKRLAAMAKNPRATLDKTERLVSERSTASYKEAAELLAELRQALAGTPTVDLAEEQARSLRAANPTKHSLIAALREKGFLAKEAKPAPSTQVRRR